MKFHAGDFLLNGAPQLGRPVEADSDQIETLRSMLCHTGDSQHIQISKISKSSTENLVHQLGYVHHFDVWVPHNLSEKTFLPIFPYAILYLNVTKDPF